MVTYTLPATGCYSTTAVSVTAVPAIGGASHVCAYGDTIYVTDAAAGGDWSSTLVTISSSGLVTGFATGVGTVTYTMPSGCYATKAITVLPVPSAITGTSHICITASTILADATPGGVWASGASAIATVGSTGAVTPLEAGIATISYTIPATGCSRTAAVTIDPLPNAGVITGAPQVCVGDTIMLTESVSGGIWSGSAAAIATVSATGIVSGVSAGTVVISYIYSNICGTVDTSKIITVNTLPDAGTITGPSNVCTDASVTLVDAVSGGVWGAVGSGISVTTGGAVNGITQGTDSVTYSVSNMCGTTRTSFAVNVITIPTPGTINATGNQLCVGVSDTLSATPTGGTWSVANSNATINTNIVTAAIPGTDTVYYILSNACGPATASLPITILQSAICDSGAGVATTRETDEQITIYPNPNPGTFTLAGSLSTTLDEMVSIEITDIPGQVIYRNHPLAKNGKLNQVISLNPANGMYLLSIQSASGIKTCHIVIEQ